MNGNISSPLSHATTVRVLSEPNRDEGEGEEVYMERKGITQEQGEHV